MTPEERAQAFFKTCPPPDAQWFVEAALIPVLAECFRAAEADVREANAKLAAYTAETTLGRHGH